MKKAYLTIMCLAVMLLTACAPQAHQQKEGEEIAMKYAKLLRIKDHGTYFTAQILNPWDTTRLLNSYVLMPSDSREPVPTHSGSVVYYPLRKTVLFSSVHCGLFKQIGAFDCIAGICDLPFICLDDVHQQIATGKMADLGNSMAPDIERMVELNPDAMLVSPFENNGYGAIEKLDIPIIECAEYMEQSALGRAEWMRFYGLLTGHRAEADSLFAAVERHYQELKALAHTATSRPTVITDRKVGATWFVSGGLSSTGQILADAGAKYVFDCYETTKAMPINFETAYEIGGEADFWFIKYNEPYTLTYSRLANEYAPYTNIKAFREQHVFVCNTAKNTFFEDVPFHPDILLHDLISILHPELLPRDTATFFSDMEP